MTISVLLALVRSQVTAVHKKPHLLYDLAFSQVANAQRPLRCTYLPLVQSAASVTFGF